MTTLPSIAKLPSETAAYIAELYATGRFKNPTRLWRGLILRWALWHDGHDGNALPGWHTCPPDCGKGHPAGLTAANVRRICQATAATAVNIGLRYTR